MAAARQRIPSGRWETRRRGRGCVPGSQGPRGGGGRSTVLPCHCWPEAAGRRRELRESLLDRRRPTDRAGDEDPRTGRGNRKVTARDGKLCSQPAAGEHRRMGAGWREEERWSETERDGERGGREERGEGESQPAFPWGCHIPWLCQQASPQLVAVQLQPLGALAPAMSRAPLGGGTQEAHTPPGGPGFSSSAVGQALRSVPYSGLQAVACEEGVLSVSGLSGQERRPHLPDAYGKAGLS